MNLLTLEERMQERGASLVGSKMTHDRDSYTVVGVDLVNDKRKMTVRYKDQNIDITMNNWNVIAIQYDMVRGFVWRMR